MSHYHGHDRARGQDRSFRHGNYAVKIVHGLIAIFLLLLLTACPNRSPESAAPPGQCTATWYRTVEATVSSGDGMGHGPDIGSEEWQSVIEFKLGVRGNPDVPERNSQEWCRFIDDLL